MFLSVWDVLKSPVITEKANELKDITSNTRQLLTFRVHVLANKIQICEAVEKIFNVKVYAVRTANYAGKKVRRGRLIGYRSDWKKAFVTLEPGHVVGEYADVV